MTAKKLQFGMTLGEYFYREKRDRKERGCHVKEKSV
jgi:hypothetical protein